MKKSIISAAILAAAIGGFAGSASAAAITVNYTQNSGFVFNSLTPTESFIGVDGVVSPAITPDTRYESLWWGNDNPTREQASTNGTPINTTLNSDNSVASATAAFWTTNNQGNNQPDSALKVVGITSGSITSGAGYVPISHVFHSNQTINDRDNGLLSSGIIRSLLNINGVDTPVNDVAFTFLETDNGNSAYNCPVSGTPASCDIFQFAFAGFNPIQLNIGDTLYDLSFDLIGFSDNAYIIDSDNAWGNDACQEGFFCVLTREANVNWLTVGMRLDEQQVPEPGSLALMSLGLFGIGAALRRRKNRS